MFGDTDGEPKRQAMCSGTVAAFARGRLRTDESVCLLVVGPTLL
jgi:hypothetical protein